MHDGAPSHSLRRLRVGLGTWIAIVATGNSEATALAAIERAFAAVAEVGDRMHPSRPRSDLARINGSRPGTRVAIHSSTHRVLLLAQRLHSLSDGVFDPCLPGWPGRLSDVEISPGTTAHAPWVICHAPLSLDLGGIAKGYAVDCGIEALARSGCSSGLVNAGGDLRLFGERCETILLRNTDRTLQPLALENTALAVSTVDAPQTPREYRGYYNRARASPPTRRYAAVLAGEAMTGDALTKCVLLCPHAQATRILTELGGREAA